MNVSFLFRFHALLAASVLSFSSVVFAEDISAIPAVPNFQPGPEHADSVRKWQGISSLERTPGGRLWATWYTGGVTEDHHNYVVVVTSSDDGKTWSPFKFVLDPDGNGPVRAFDPCPWIDPSGKLWLFWCQATKGGGGDPHTFAITTDQPEEENPKWSEPVRIHDGVMMCKPTVLKDGTWLLPTAIWFRENSCRIVASTDQGKTWTLRGVANVPSQQGRNCDEPMIVQKQDGTLWLWIRTTTGIGESFSTDGGKTWSEAVPSSVLHTPSRFFIRRLKSGNLLLVKHGPIKQKTGRAHLAAFLSKDDGKTWEGGLLLDERNGVSYPDGAESPHGVMYITYDFDRVGEKNIYLTTFTEEDILAGKDVSGNVRQRVLINHAAGKNPHFRQPIDHSKLEFHPNADGAPMKPGPGAVIEAVEGEVIPFEKGTSLFTNRSYHVHGLPKALEKKKFIRTKIDGTAFRVKQDGLLLILTPVAERNNDSITSDLLNQGFKKVNLPEFLLFGEANAAGNICTTFQKEVKAGAEFKFGKWGIVLSE